MVAARSLELSARNRSAGHAAVQGRLQPADVAFVLAFALPLVIGWVAYARRLVWLKWLCIAGYAAWLGLQIQTWWVAYIFGASDTWTSTCRRVFSESTQILPSSGRHLAPDGVHFVLQLLLLIVVGALLIDVSRGPRRGVNGGLTML